MDVSKPSMPDADTYQTYSGSREISEKLYLIQSCRDRELNHIRFAGQGEGDADQKQAHSNRAAYLIDDEKSMLFDTLSPLATETVLYELDQLLDEPLDYLVVSHPDIPHAGNARAIQRQYPDVTLIAPKYGEGHELYYLDEASKVEEQDTLDLGEHTVTFHQAAFLDAPISLWMSEEKTGALFTVDWMGMAHFENECVNFIDELPYDDQTMYDLLYEFHASVLFWFEYVNIEKTCETIDHLIDKHEPTMVLPSHGLVIRKDPIKYLNMIKDVIKDMQGRKTDEYTVTRKR